MHIASKVQLTHFGASHLRMNHSVQNIEPAQGLQRSNGFYSFYLIILLSKWRQTWQQQAANMQQHMIITPHIYNEAPREAMALRKAHQFCTKIHTTKLTQNNEVKFFLMTLASGHNPNYKPLLSKDKNFKIFVSPSQISIITYK